MTAERPTPEKATGSVIDLVDFAGKDPKTKTASPASTTTVLWGDHGNSGDLTDTRTVRHVRKISQGGISTPFASQKGKGTQQVPQRARTPSRDRLRTEAAATTRGGETGRSTSQERSNVASTILPAPSTLSSVPQPPSGDASSPAEGQAQATASSHSSSQDASSSLPPSPKTPSSPTRRPSTLPHVRTPADNRYLSSRHYATFSQIASNECYSIDNQTIWQSALSGDRLPQPQTSQEALDLEMLTLQIGQSFTKNNPMTGNFNVLLLYLLSHMRFMRVMAYDGAWTVEAYNALFLVRLCTKHFVDNLTQIQIHEQFEMDRTLSLKSQMTSQFKSDQAQMALDSHVVHDKRLRAQQLLEELFHIIIYADASTVINYDFYMEAMNLIIVMCSAQLYQPLSSAVEGSYFIDIVMDRLSHFAGGAMQRLLMNFVHRPPPVGSSGGMLYSAYSYLFATKKPEGAAPSPLGDKSAILFLILSAQNPKHFANEFKEAIKRFQDSNVSDSSQMAEDDHSINVSFRHVYQTLCSNISSEEAGLILYPLLLHNRNFRSYMLSRTDPEGLLLPILKQIYELVEQRTNYPQLYILLVLILLLSQDDVLTDSMQRIIIPTQPWYTERVLKSVSLGGLTILVLIRCIQANLSTFKDTYSHTVCVAILANMARNISGIHSIVAQRVVSFYDMVAKRYLKLTGQLARESSEDVSTPTTSIQPDPAEDDPDTIIYGDLVAVLLEMINSVVTYSIKHNPELVYALLHKREAFVQFKLHPRFGDLVENIDTVISYFHDKLLEADLKMPSAADVAGVIDRASKTWSISKLKVISVLKFHYEEDANDWQFLMSYIWTCDPIL
ncbi:hypothetical protein SpCBS45565_g06202 [Spizellomyces sp. 'palustris']|nr:hypothetical protein SpCBS45565_g06202 [Spizellomyces sp. 'palustris']